MSETVKKAIFGQGTLPVTTRWQIWARLKRAKTRRMSASKMAVIGPTEMLCFIHARDRSVRSLCCCCPAIAAQYCPRASIMPSLLLLSGSMLPFLLRVFLLCLLQEFPNASNGQLPFPASRIASPAAKFVVIVGMTHCMKFSSSLLEALIGGPC